MKISINIYIGTTYICNHWLGIDMREEQKKSNGSVLCISTGYMEFIIEYHIIFLKCVLYILLVKYIKNLCVYIHVFSESQLLNIYQQPLSNKNILKLQEVDL